MCGNHIVGIICIESLSSIKINYSKTELISMDIDTKQTTLLAALVGCKISNFFLKYLRVSLSDSKLKKMTDWQNIIDKVQNKIPNRKGDLLSIGGREFSFLIYISLYAFFV
jgi:uncharacterized membrane protein YwzB